MVQTRSKRLMALETLKQDELSTSKTPNPPPPDLSSPSTSIIRVTARSIFLNDDWWLIKVDGNKLGIGGFTHTRAVGVKCFSSTPISARHCDTVLETTDGIVITISGLLNLQRTHRNGFPASVCSKFMHGFPFDWEDYATCRASKRASSVSDEFKYFPRKVGNKFSPSLDDVPMTMMRDLLMSTLEIPGHDLIVKKIYSDALRICKRDASEHSTPAAEEKAESGRVEKERVGFGTGSRVTTRSMSRGIK